MKKRFLCILSLVCCICCFFSVSSVQAAEPGLYNIKIVMVESTRDSITGQKEKTCSDNNGNPICKATLTGSFTYNGVSASCTASSCSITIYNSSWSTKTVNTYTSGNSAVADVTIERKFLFITLETLTFSVTLSCDRYGNLT